MKWPKRVAEAIEERSGGLCEGCGKRPATEKHHRKYASRGGESSVENALHLCGMGNHTGCHGIAHSGEGAELGFSVHSWEEPSLVHVLYRGSLRWLTFDGGTTTDRPET